MRECIETSIIVSTLLAFLKQTLPTHSDASVREKLVRQVSTMLQKTADAKSPIS
jgi:high-affinity iron transporter